MVRILYKIRYKIYWATIIVDIKKEHVEILKLKNVFQVVLLNPGEQDLVTLSTIIRYATSVGNPQIRRFLSLKRNTNLQIFNNNP